jgi:hypothetical protein
MLGHMVRLMPPSYVKAYVKRSKNDANDAAAICEAVTRPSMRWCRQIDLDAATLHVRRVKSGKPATHPIRGDELRPLRKLQREEPKATFVFVSERGGSASSRLQSTRQRHPSRWCGVRSGL